MKYDHPQAIWEGINPCPQHPRYDEDCDDCDHEMSARSARIEQMQAAAQDILRDIANNGGPQMPQSVMLEARLEVLIDSVLVDPKDRVRYEGEVGRRVMLTIKDMQQQIKQPTLHLPNGVTPIRGRKP